MPTVKIQEIIKQKRIEKKLSQEALAEAFGISVQAVSKWENGLSYPDLMMLPKICDYFDIDMDFLFYGNEKSVSNELPDDDVYRIVICRGKKILSREEACDNDTRIKLDFSSAKVSKIEIWGSADINGSVKGDINAGSNINCGSVHGNIETVGLNCGSVQGNIKSDSIKCGGVHGNIEANGDVNCGDVGGNVQTKGNISCQDIKRDVIAANQIKCKKIGGAVNCDKVIYLKSDDDTTIKIR